MKLTVFFNGQYWVGVVELQEGKKLKASQFIFGSEPKDAEVMDFVHHQMLGLLSSSKEQVDIRTASEQKVNPKRLARQVAKEMRTTGVSTFAQEAMKLDLALRKKERKATNKKKDELLQEKKYLLKVQKAKEKHRGR
ncbi:YjdF family protein [Brevibacillus sp. SIMBA_040]|uniref:YjdF family protein n=1 Tax=unclassified Brevibacillus TaxID=2684853 RepID=UPI00397B43F2